MYFIFALYPLEIAIHPLFFLSAKNEIKLRGIQEGYPNPFTQTRPLKGLPNTRKNT